MNIFLRTTPNTTLQLDVDPASTVAVIFELAAKQPGAETHPEQYLTINGERLYHVDRTFLDHNIHENATLTLCSDKACATTKTKVDPPSMLVPAASIINSLGSVNSDNSDTSDTSNTSDDDDDDDNNDVNPVSFQDSQVDDWAHIVSVHEEKEVVEKELRALKLKIQMLEEDRTSLLNAACRSAEEGTERVRTEYAVQMAKKMYEHREALSAKDMECRLVSEEKKKLELQLAKLHESESASQSRSQKLARRCQVLHKEKKSMTAKEQENVKLKKEICCLKEKLAAEQKKSVSLMMIIDTNNLKARIEKRRSENTVTKKKKSSTKKPAAAASAATAVAATAVAAAAASASAASSAISDTTSMPLVEHHQQLVRASNDKRLVSKGGGMMVHLVKKLPFILRDDLASLAFKLTRQTHMDLRQHCDGTVPSRPLIMRDGSSVSWTSLNLVVSDVDACHQAVERKERGPFFIRIKKKKKEAKETTTMTTTKKTTTMTKKNKSKPRFSIVVNDVSNPVANPVPNCANPVPVAVAAVKQEEDAILARIIKQKKESEDADAVFARQLQDQEDAVAAAAMSSRGGRGAQHERQPAASGGGGGFTSRPNARGIASRSASSLSRLH